MGITIFIFIFNFLQVQQKQKYIVQLSNELSSNDDRIHAMSDHLKNIRQELQHTQVFINDLPKKADISRNQIKILVAFIFLFV